VTRACRANTSLPLMVKLSPNVGNIVEIALAVEEAGADCISVANTLVAMTIDVEHRRPYLAHRTGGLSGPAVRPVIVRMVYQVAGAVSVPVVGVGGVTSTHDALEYLMAGATAVQVGTANFVNPRTALEILDGLKDFFMSRGISRPSEIVGAAQPVTRSSGPTVLAGATVSD
jgi:dihydroorotate dehydrogenase (NAD+) catalytic subunit